MSESEYLSVPELAELLRCSTPALYKKLQRGLIPEQAIVRISPRKILFKKWVLNRTILKGGYDCRSADTGGTQ